MEPHLTATECHLPHDITHTVLAVTRHKWTHRALTTASQPILDLPTQRDGRLSLPSGLATYQASDVIITSEYTEW